MKQLLQLLPLALCLSSCAQPVPAPSAAVKAHLKRELDSLLVRDQVFRQILMDPARSKERDSLVAAHRFPAGKEMEGLSALMLEADSSNLSRVRVIIARYGYPGKSLVGVPTNEAAFFVLQHSDRIRQYLPLVKQAAEQNELPFRLYAMMLDRQRMQAGQPQVYGSQGFGFTAVNPVTGETEQHKFIWPIQNPSRVNERRRQAGFDLTVEQNALRLGIPYQALTLGDIKRMGYRQH